MHVSIDVNRNVLGGAVNDTNSNAIDGPLQAPDATRHQLPYIFDTIAGISIKDKAAKLTNCRL